MRYRVYQFHFTTGVRFGKNSLADTEMSFRSDTLFSALCQESLQRNGEKGIRELVEWADSGKLLISDAMPYKGEHLYIPKPMILIKSETEDSESKKLYKRLNYIDYYSLEDFMAGKYDITQDHNKAQNFGYTEMNTKVAIHPDKDSEPYNVASFHFLPSCGLYVIIGCADEMISDVISDYLEGISANGIGGRRSSGLGKFEIHTKKLPRDLEERVNGAHEKYVLINTAMADDAELEKALDGAAYLLLKRSGYVDSERYSRSEVFLKKKDLFMFKAGSCFSNPFKGMVFDVSENGAHPVYRYGKGLFLGVQ